MTTKRKTKSQIKQAQWNMPVSFTSGGKIVTLKDFVKRDCVALALPSLSDDQRAQLTAKRIQLQPEFELGMIGAGVVDKDRAIAEVKAKTPVGRTLIEIETRVIQHLIDQAKEEAPE